MAAPRTITVKSIAEFATHIDKLLKGARKASPPDQKSMNWYRGHSRSSAYKLEPGLYRHPTIRDIDELVSLETRMIEEFQRQNLLHSYQGAIDDPKELIGLLFYMQHNGIPTRLLDWTSNPFIALYFALSGAKRNDKGVCDEPAAVWVLDPFRWNQHALRELSWGSQGPAKVDDREVATYLPAKLPRHDKRRTMYHDAVALIGSANSQRMLAQRGHFTLFGEGVEPMEKAFDSRGFPKDALVKLEVPETEIDDVLSVLLALGYTDSVAYPDLQGLAMEIRRLHGFSA